AFAVAFALVFALVFGRFGRQWLQENDNNPGLTGEVRSQFVQSAVSSCIKSAPSNNELATLSPSVISQYCTCYANGLADRLSFNEVTSTQNPDKAMEALEPKADEAIDACVKSILKQ